MEHFLDAVAMLPPWLVVGSVTVAVSLAGVLISRVFVAMNDKSRRALLIRLVIIVPPVVVAGQIGRSWAPELEARAAVNALAAQPIYAAVFARDPAAKAELRAALVAAVAADGTDAARDAFNARARTIINRTFQASIGSSSPAAVHALFENEARMMDALANDPALCLAYHQGMGVPPDAVPEGLIQEALDRKAAVIRAASTARVPAAPVTMQTAVDLLVAAYRSQGYPDNQALEVANLGNMAPSDACAAAVRYAHALAALSPDDAATIARLSATEANGDTAEAPSAGSAPSAPGQAAPATDATPATAPTQP
jgi:hypothetical protein